MFPEEFFPSEIFIEFPCESFFFLQVGFCGVKLLNGIDGFREGFVAGLEVAKAVLVPPYQVFFGGFEFFDELEKWGAKDQVIPSMLDNLRAATVSSPDGFETKRFRIGGFKAR